MHQIKLQPLKRQFFDQIKFDAGVSTVRAKWILKWRDYRREKFEF